MAVLAQSDNNLMVDLTKKSAADARTLKTITILTLIYLPASFVSVSGLPCAQSEGLLICRRHSWEWAISILMRLIR